MGVNDIVTTTIPLDDLEVYRQIFENADPNVTIDSFEESQGSKQGDNYTAALYRVVLKGHTSKDEDGKKLKWEKVVICKRLPDSQIRREAYKSEHLFRNEREFYNCVLPELQKFQRSKCVDTQLLFNAAPQCYYAYDDLIVLEDLCLRGYKMQDRLAGLQPNQLKALFSELAKFHSLSLSYNEQHPEEFKQLKTKINEGLFCADNTEWYRNYYKILTENALQMITTTITEPKYVNKMKELCNNIFPKIVQLLNKKTKLGVLCHGDCWTNNVLFKFSEAGDIIETCFVDFQLMRYGSLTLDIANVLYCSVETDIRKKYKDELLWYYYEELVKNLKSLGPLPRAFKNKEQLWQQIQDEFKTFAKFGIYLGMDMLPISTCSSEEAPNVYQEENEVTIGAPPLSIPVNDVCRKRMTDLLVELVDEGLL